MKRIYSASDLVEAHLLVQLLREAGIECHVFNENLQGGVGEIPFTHAYPEIWVVDEADEARARALIQEYERAGRSAPSWRCPYCGEDNPGTFLSCWQCGRERDGDT